VIYLYFLTLHQFNKFTVGTIIFKILFVSQVCVKNKTRSNLKFYKEQGGGLSESMTRPAAKKQRTTSFT